MTIIMYSIIIVSLIIIGSEFDMGRVCHGPSLYGPSLLWAERRPSLSCAEFVMDRVVQLPSGPTFLYAATFFFAA